MNVGDIARWIIHNFTLCHALLRRVLLFSPRGLALALALTYGLALLRKSARGRRIDDELLDFIAACIHLIARNLLVEHSQCRFLGKIIT